MVTDCVAAKLYCCLFNKYQQLKLYPKKIVNDLNNVQLCLTDTVTVQLNKIDREILCANLRKTFGEIPTNQ